MHSEYTSLVNVIHQEYILICVFKVEIKEKTHSKEICFLLSLTEGQLCFETTTKIPSNLLQTSVTTCNHFQIQLSSSDLTEMYQSVKGYSASYQQHFDVLPHFGSATIQPTRDVILSSSSQRNRGSGEVRKLWRG